MSGTTKFPTAIDDNTTLDETLTDGPTGDDVLAAHQNNQNVAIKAIEAKIGVDSSAVDSSIDYLLRTLLGWDFSGGTTLNPSGITWTSLGTVTTADINGGSLDGVIIGAASAADATVTDLVADTLTLDGHTITLDEDFDISGAYALTLTLSAATNVTLPTTGTLATLTGSETFTNKTLTSPTITSSPTASGATWASLGTVTTVDINGGTIDGVTIGGSSADAGSFTTITASDDITVNENLILGTGSAFSSSEKGLRGSAAGVFLQALSSMVFTIDADNNGTDSFSFYDGNVEASGTLLALLSDTGQLSLPVTGSSAGILIGGDVQLYRSATNELSLAVGDSFKINSASLTQTSTSTATAASSVYGSSFQVTASPASASSSGHVALQALATTSSQYISNNVTGFDAVGRSTADTGVTIPVVRGMTASIHSLGAGTITNARAIQIEDPAKINNGTVTNNYGLYISNMTKGESNYGIYVTGASTYALWVDSGETRLDGRAGIGTTPNSATALSVYEQRTDTSGVIRGTQSVISFAPAGATSASPRGMDGSVNLATAQTFSGTITGVNGVITGSNVSFTVSDIIGVQATPFFSSASTGTITSAKGLNVSNATLGGATITTQYGIYVSNMTSGGTDYGIYVAGADTYSLFIDSGDSRFDGNVIMGGLPTSDPNTAGQLWNDSGTLKVSAG